MKKKSVPQARKEQKAGKTVKKAIPARKRLPISSIESKKKTGEGADKGVFTGKQARFIDEYLIDLNAAQAAIRAGYSAATARQIGYEILTKPYVQEVIAAKQRELAHKSGVTRERLVAEAARLAFSDVRKLFDKEGNLVNIHDLDDETAAALSSVELIVTGNGQDVIMTKKLKMWDKNSALDKLLKHLGMDDGNPKGQSGVVIVPAKNPG